MLEALVRALQLGEAERAHLYDLARACQPSARGRRRSSKQNVRPSVQWVLDSMTGSPAFAENGRLAALATNRLGRAFYSHLFDGTGRPVNFARFIFLDFCALAAYMAAAGKESVWGAEEGNRASNELARKLGFEPVERVAIMRPGQ